MKWFPLAFPVPVFSFSSRLRIMDRLAVGPKGKVTKRLSLDAKTQESVNDGGEFK